jgi:Protein O-mannosyl-transferase TMEM260-like
MARDVGSDIRSAGARVAAPDTRRFLAPLCAGGVGLAALLLYLKTLAPTVTLVDSGELIVTARDLGVAHPPGFPLYTLLAHAATWLPFGTVATRVHLASAVFAAVASAALTLLVFEARPDAPRARRPRPKARGGRATAAGDVRLALAGSVVAGLLFATSRTLWSYATIAEVYTLNAMLVVIAFLLVVRWRRRTLAAEGDPGDALLYGAAGVMGLALGVHHVTAGLTIPALGVLVYSAARRRPIGRAVIVRTAGCFAAGLAVYAYLPLAASTSPLIDWGDPRTLQRFWWHITGRQYQVFLSWSPATMVDQLRGAFVRYVTREFGPPWLPVALGLGTIGLVRLWKRDRTLCVSLALVVLADLAYALNYDIAEDKDAYYLPTFIALAIAAGLGAARVLEAGARRPPLAGAALAAVVAAVPAASLVANLPYTNRSHYFIAHDYVDNILSTVGHDGLLLTSDWQVYSPFLYVRHVEGARPDVAVIDVNLLRRSWYFAYLEREYPGLMGAARRQVDLFLEDLKRWEQDPGVYQRDVDLNRRINTRFYDMLAAMVAAHLPSGPVYVTEDVPAMDRDLAARLAAYRQIPQGLVFQVTAAKGFVPPADPPLEMRGLFDHTIAFEPDDVVRAKVAPVYLNMLVNRGRYLAANGLRDRAEALFERVLALDPGDAAARESLAARGAPAAGGG